MALIGVIFGLAIYQNKLSKNLSNASCDSLDGLVKQQIFAFATKFDDQRRTLINYASFFATTEFEKADLVSFLNGLSDNSTFDYISYVTPDGDSIQSTGEMINISDRDYFIRALAGETVISDPVMSRSSGKSIVPFATPVVKDGQISAVIVGNYNTDYLASLIMPTFNGDGYTYITTKTGDIVAKTETDSSLSHHKNLFEALGLVKFNMYGNLDDLTTNVSETESGHFHYAFDNENRFMHYAPLGINDWYVFSVAPERVIAPQMLSIMQSTSILILCVAVIFLLALLFFFYDKSKHLKELSKIAYTDGLTGASNRKKFKLDAADILKASSASYALVYLDIDKFKVLNDTLGYPCGDKLLISIANIIRASISDHEAFGRGDSDQFFLLLEYANDAQIKERVVAITQEIQVSFKEQQDIGYNLVLCAGIYVIVDKKEQINLMSDRAKHAHQLVKGSQISNVAFYNEEIRERILREKDIENKMHDALINDEFMLYLQPKYRLDDETICGAEALVRWNVGGDAVVYPDQFIPLFEKNGFITKLDLYMLEKSCIVIKNWIDAGIMPIPISINFSRVHLKNPNFVSDIAAIVSRYKVPPKLIEVELTESTMLDNEDVLIDLLNDLHEHGFTLSMDDFGSGYSSLGLLKNLSVDTVKLDKTFFTRYLSLSRAKIVISNMIIMTKELGIFTVAEGVETQENIDLLRELGCDIVQGYYFARPMPSKELDRLVCDVSITC